MKLVLELKQMVEAEGLVVKDGAVFTVNEAAFDVAEGEQLPLTTHL